ncbi:MAG: tyrosine recombinase [Eubacteriales bacterium]|nr:tyrosine recombinase [Eubacteriales bacterium]
MKELIRCFGTYLLTERGASQNTRLSYERDIRALSEHLTERGIMEAEQVGPGDLCAYIAALKDAGKSASTVSRSIAAIRAFFAYLNERNILASDPAAMLKAPKVVKKTPEVLADGEVERLLEVPSLKTPKGMRDRAMLELLYATGLRVSELTGLMIGDVDKKQHMLIVRGGSKTRLVPYDRRSARYLGRYMDTARGQLLGEAETETLFVNCQGEEMSRQGFWKLIKKYGREAGIEAKLTPHMMRHSFAVHALKNGTDLKQLQTILGHSDASTTHSYMELGL